MRDRSLANDLRDKIIEAYVAFRRARHEDDLDAEYDAWVDAGNSAETFEERVFAKISAQRDGAVLAAQALDPDREAAREAEETLTTLGMDTLSALAEIHASWASNTNYHNRKIVELEKRFRDLNAILMRFIAAPDRDHGGSRMTSVRQQAANRRNAARSTGPKSECGKAIAAKNARSHGLTAAPPESEVEAWLRIILNRAILPPRRPFFGMRGYGALTGWRKPRRVLPRFENATQ